MRPVFVQVVGSTGGPAANGISAVVPLDYTQAPFSVGIGTVVSGTTTTWSVQHTFDNFQDSNAPGFTSNPTWFTNAGINGVSANTDGNYAFGVRAVRLNVASGTGTVSMTVIQGRRGS